MGGIWRWRNKLCSGDSEQSDDRKPGWLKEKEEISGVMMFREGNGRMTQTNIPYLQFWNPRNSPSDTEKSLPYIADNWCKYYNYLVSLQSSASPQWTLLSLLQVNPSPGKCQPILTLFLSLPSTKKLRARVKGGEGLGTGDVDISCFSCLFCLVGSGFPCSRPWGHIPWECLQAAGQDK